MTGDLHVHRNIYDSVFGWTQSDLVGNYYSSDSFNDKIAYSVTCNDLKLSIFNVSVFSANCEALSGNLETLRLDFHVILFDRNVD